MQSYAIGNPDYSVAWRGEAVDALRALDAFADQEGFALYSDIVQDEELDQECGGIICQLADGQIWAIFTNYSVTPMQTDFLMRTSDGKLWLPRTNADSDPLCPICGRAMDNLWAHDGEAWAADYFHCDERSEGCGAGGALVKTTDVSKTQNDIDFDLEEVEREPMFITRMETQHFSFLGLGATAEEAEQAVADGFTRHLEQTTPGVTTAKDAREQFLAHTGLDDEGYLIEDGHAFDGRFWKDALNEYYGFRSVEIQPGQCSVDEDRLV